MSSQEDTHNMLNKTIACRHQKTHTTCHAHTYSRHEMMFTVLYASKMMLSSACKILRLVVPIPMTTHHPYLLVGYLLNAASNCKCCIKLKQHPNLLLECPAQPASKFPSAGFYKEERSRGVEEGCMSVGLEGRQVLQSQASLTYIGLVLAKVLKFFQQRTIKDTLAPSICSPLQFSIALPYEIAAYLSI